MHIHSELHRALLAAAAASPHAEICGLLYGDADAIRAMRALPNVAADPADAFEIDPAALLAAYREGRQGGAQPIGHYHSHPTGSATPSPRDLAAAAPQSLWLILGYDARGGLESRLWRERDGNFVEVNLIFAWLAPE